LNFRALDFSLNDDEITYFNNITDFEYHPLEQKMEKGMGNYECKKQKSSLR